MPELTETCRQELITALARHLNSHDKAWMFMLCNFRELVDEMNLESNGSPVTRAWNIYDKFRTKHMLGSLMACMNSVFDLNLYLILE